MLNELVRETAGAGIRHKYSYANDVEIDRVLSEDMDSALNELARKETEPVIAFCSINFDVQLSEPVNASSFVALRWHSPPFR